jgi:hypothetical protein
MDNVDELLVEVRASTQGFARDIAAMRSSFDGTLVEGFSRAGDVLERGLLTAIRKGSQGIEDLQSVALRALDQIAGQALRMGLDKILGGGGSSPSGGGLGGLLGGTIGALFGLPGRATGGPVSPGSGDVVGERGPELFVPTSAGRIETAVPGGKARDVRVSINLSSPRGASAPVAMQRSSRQVASAVRRALLV